MKPQKELPPSLDTSDFPNRYTVNDITNCWNWNTPNKQRGYGSYRGFPAHRVAWLIFHGCDPIGNYVLHTCDNRRCVNPAHLYLGTQSDNLRDMWGRGRRKYNKGRAKHGWAKVNHIRDLYATGKFSLAELGREFKMNRSMIYKIVNNQIWKP